MEIRHGRWRSVGMALHKVRAIVLPDVAPFELGIAAEVFGIDRRDTGGPVFDFAVVTPEPGRVPTRAGFDLVIERGLEDAADADVLVVTPLRVDGEAPEAMLETLRAAHERGAWVVSLCSGAFALAQAGLLDGRRATTHWMHAAALAERYPAVTVDPGVLYVQEGRLLTSAGTAAGIDACLHLVRTEFGAEQAMNVARRMVVPPHRDGGQAQFVDAPMPECADDSLSGVLDWAAAHPREDLSVRALAHAALTSERTFARRFRAVTGTTPAAWVARMRLAHAQRLPESSDLAIEEVAREAGFGEPAVLRQHFSRTLGTSPRAYRERFRAA